MEFFPTRGIILTKLMQCTSLRIKFVENYFVTYALTF